MFSSAIVRAVVTMLRAAVRREHVKPSVLFEQLRKEPRALHDLERIGRVDGTHQAERQASARVIAVRRVVGLPILSAERGVRKNPRTASTTTPARGWSVCRIKRDRAVLRIF